ncbi:MAG: hypothetical protein JWN50_720 [Parcubacteria group bacterium]|nr:hypothetical protein [Parcubacteria group bacterium]
MKHIRAIDAMVLRFCTKVAHAFQLLTGRTNFFIAKLGVLIASIAVTLGIANYFHPLPHHPKSKLEMIFCILYMPVLISRALGLDEADRARSTSAEKTAIPGITNGSSFGVRATWLYFALWDTFSIIYQMQSPVYTIVDALWDVSLSYGLMIFYYFIAVEPLRPPKE